MQFEIPIRKILYEKFKNSFTASVFEYLFSLRDIIGYLINNSKVAFITNSQYVVFVFELSPINNLSTFNCMFIQCVMCI